jgi:hypothetical protein
MMRGGRLPWLVLGAGIVLLTGGCHALGRCNNPAAYAGAREVPPLKMPVGLDGPDTSRALEIPPLDQPEVPRGAGAPCLEDPPVWEGAPKSAAETPAQSPSKPARKPRAGPRR